MPLIDKVTDADLRLLIYKYDHVIVKFVDDKCLVCIELEPTYMAFAAESTYESIQFMRMNACENPVSSREVSLTGTPFVATYYKGRLQECGLVNTADDIKLMLTRLLQNK